MFLIIAALVAASPASLPDGGMAPDAPTVLKLKTGGAFVLEVT